MRSYTPREIRIAVLLTVVLTVFVTAALLDPSCQRRTDMPHTAPTRSLAPR
jgi:hypothetical protein